MSRGNKKGEIVLVNKITLTGFVSGGLFMLGCAMLKEQYHGWEVYGIFRPSFDCLIAIGMLMLSMRFYAEIKEG